MATKEGGDVMKVKAKENDNGDVPHVIAERVAMPPVEEAKKEKRELRITAPKMEQVAVLIRGTALYCQNRFSKKAFDMMKAKQEAGSAAKKKKNRDPKDFMACYEEAKHISREGWCGIPAAAFRNAMISACRLVNFKMTIGKLTVRVIEDGLDKIDNSGLVKIVKGEPRYSELPARNATGVCDIRARPIWDPGWEAVVRIRYDAEQFKAEEVLNLLRRVGEQVGVGEGRPDSPNSNGLGWGMFEIVRLVED